MRFTLRQHPLLLLFAIAATCLGFISTFYLYCFHFHVWPALLFLEVKDSWFEPALCFISVLLMIVVILAVGFIILMRKYTNRLMDEIQERSAAEKAREEMRQALLQSQKLEAVGLLAGGIAHNFNNILYAIQGYVQLARSDVSHCAIPYQNLGKVLEAVERGKELVQGILCFSRREQQQFERISLEEVLKSAIKLLHCTLPATIELELSCELNDPFLSANRTQLQQVFINIIRNAADSLGEKGKISVRASKELDPEGLKLLRPGLPYTAYYVITITDNGSGMTEETMRHLFEPFFTTKDVGKGTGLGLATARSIVRDHRGEVIVQSSLNKGSTFTVLLPLDLGGKEKK